MKKLLRRIWAKIVVQAAIRNRKACETNVMMIKAELHQALTDLSEYKHREIQALLATDLEPDNGIPRRSHV